MQVKPMAVGTFRITTNGWQIYEKTAKSWKKSLHEFPAALKVIKLFKAYNNFKVLIDKKEPRFLKGQLSPEGQPQGARINILPNGKVLDKAYSLLATNLTIHDQDSHDHWDVIYKNKGGTYAYCYTLDKKKQHMKEKYQKVKEFDKYYSLLSRKVSLALKDKTDSLSVPMYTLLKTYMRVGNEIYYQAHGHKGLTTLKKKDISINGNQVVFNYIAKDGVPILVKYKFPDIYIHRLKNHLAGLNNSDFVFPLKETQFKQAFRRYCGKEFYPHIVRSYYATTAVKEFLRKKKKATADEINSLFLSIAAKLGHKRYVKKEKVWKDNYTVTVNHYVQPELVQKLKSLTK